MGCFGDDKRAPDGYISVGRSITDEEFERIKAEWRARYPDSVAVKIWRPLPPDPTTTPPAIIGDFPPWRFPIWRRIWNWLGSKFR